jgi:hypothetical protein
MNRQTVGAHANHTAFIANYSCTARW